jgi:hypothetical protein
MTWKGKTKSELREGIYKPMEETEEKGQKSLTGMGNQ